MRRTATLFAKKTADNLPNSQEPKASGNFVKETLPCIFGIFAVTGLTLGALITENRKSALHKAHRNKEEDRQNNDESKVFQWHGPAN